MYARHEQVLNKREPEGRRDAIGDENPLDESAEFRAI